MAVSGEGIVVIGSTGGAVLNAALEESESMREVTRAVVTDRDCGLLEVSERHEIASFVVGGSTNREISDEAHLLLKTIRPALVISFWTRLFEGPILEDKDYLFVNFHPTLLPRHRGQNGLQHSIQSLDEILGASVHEIDSGVDTGPVLVQTSFDRSSPLFRLTERHAIFRTQVHQLMLIAEFCRFG